MHTLILIAKKLKGQRHLEDLHIHVDRMTILKCKCECGSR
jgi:hypothetical protein